jgi:hypothetical protein
MAVFVRRTSIQYRGVSMEDLDTRKCDGGVNVPGPGLWVSETV